MTQPWDSWLNNRQSCCWYFTIELKGALDCLWCPQRVGRAVHPGLPSPPPSCDPFTASPVRQNLGAGADPPLQSSCLKQESSNWGFLPLPKEKATTQGAELKCYRITASSTAAAHLWLFTATLNIHRVVPKKKEWGRSRTTELVLHQRRFRLDIRRKLFLKRIFNFAKIF